MRTELHRHLDASFRPATMLELVQRFGIEAPFKTIEDVRSRFWLTHQMRSLKEVLDCFKMFQLLMRDEEVLERLALETVLDAKAEGIDAIELRYSPTFTAEHSGIGWNEALQAFLRGMNEGMRRTGVKAGLLCILSRGFGRDLAEKTMDFALENREHFIGVDLAGLEEGYPCRLYEGIFKRASDASMSITMHAGEACGPENVWEAIDLCGATRIGHGINSIKDAELMKRLARDKILLEVCPTSNYITRSIDAWPDHPLKRFLDAGIPVSISTDDPGIFGVTLEEEYARCRKYLGLTDADLTAIDEYASLHSFLE